MAWALHECGRLFVLPPHSLCLCTNYQLHRIRFSAWICRRECASHFTRWCLFCSDERAQDEWVNCVRGKHAVLWYFSRALSKTLACMCVYRCVRVHDCATRQADATGFEREKKLTFFSVRRLPLWRLKMCDKHSFLDRRAEPMMSIAFAICFISFAFERPTCRRFGTHTQCPVNEQTFLYLYLSVCWKFDKMWHNIWRSAVPTICIHIQYNIYNIKLIRMLFKCVYQNYFVVIIFFFSNFLVK